jgi:hypothetical protein
MSKENTTNCSLRIPKGIATWSVLSTDYCYPAQPLVLVKTSNPTVYKNAFVTNATGTSIFLVQWITALGLDVSKWRLMGEDISNKTRWLSTECSLELYVRIINASVQDSLYQESTLATFTNFTSQPGDYADKPCRFNVPQNASLGIRSDDQFFLSLDSLNSMRVWLDTSFVDRVYATSDVATFGDSYAISGDILRTLFVENFEKCSTPDDRLSCVVANVAGAMTFRDSATKDHGIKMGN